jgi:hypothetical protein
VLASCCNGSADAQLAGYVAALTARLPATQIQRMNLTMNGLLSSVSRSWRSGRLPLTLLPTPPGWAEFSAHSRNEPFAISRDRSRRYHMPDRHSLELPVRLQLANMTDHSVQTRCESG